MHVSGDRVRIELMAPALTASAGAGFARSRQELCRAYRDGRREWPRAPTDRGAVHETVDLEYSCGSLEFVERRPFEAANPGPGTGAGRFPDCAEPVIGPRIRATRWLHPATLSFRARESPHGPVNSTAMQHITAAYASRQCAAIRPTGPEREVTGFAVSTAHHSRDARGSNSRCTISARSVIRLPTENQHAQAAITRIWCTLIRSVSRSPAAKESADASAVHPSIR